jgi:hypothetical protein
MPLWESSLELLSPVYVSGKINNLHLVLPGAFDGLQAIQRDFETFQKGEITDTGMMSTQDQSRSGSRRRFVLKRGSHVQRESIAGEVQQEFLVNAACGNFTLHLEMRAIHSANIILLTQSIRNQVYLEQRLR